MARLLEDARAAFVTATQTLAYRPSTSALIFAGQSERLGFASRETTAIAR